MKFSDKYTADDVATLKAIIVIAMIGLGIMFWISSEMGIYL